MPKPWGNPTRTISLAKNASNLFDSRDPDGDGVFEGGGGSVSLSGGTPSLSYSIAEISEGGKVTLETDGTYSFKNDAPELVIFFDARTGADGEQLDASQVRVGQSLNTVLNKTGGVGPEIEESNNTASLPGGRGFKIGTTHPDDLNGESFSNIGAAFDAHTVGFESRVMYMPEQHAQTILDFIANPETVPAGTNINDNLAFWQIKPLWNAAQEQFGGDGTDFFVIGQENRRSGLNTSGGFDRFLAISANANLTEGALNANYGSSGIEIIRTDTPDTFDDRPGLREITSGSETEDVPFDVPYTLEFAYDQGDVSQEDTAQFYVNYSNTQHNELLHLRVQNITLHDKNATTEADKVLSSVSFPGFVRGFNINFDCHWLYQEVYKQKGWAHVSICDTPNYFDTAKRSPLIPISWVDNKIETEIRSGWFDLSELSGKYFCVIGPDYQQIASVRIE